MNTTSSRSRIGRCAAAVVTAGIIGFSTLGVAGAANAAPTSHATGMPTSGATTTRHIPDPGLPVSHSIDAPASHSLEGPSGSDN